MYSKNIEFGDLENLGWKLCFGETQSQIEECLKSKDELMINIPKMDNLWEGISNTNRQAFKFDKHVSCKKHFGEEKMKIIIGKMLDKHMGRHEITGSSLLRNMSNSGRFILDEQEPHRDYKTVKKRV